MNYKEHVIQLKERVEILEARMEAEKEKCKQEIEELSSVKNGLILDIKIAEEKMKEDWIMNPKYLILSVKDFCLPYECEFRKYKESNWRKGYIVGSSFNTSKNYKVRTSISGNKYEWAVDVRVDPDELKYTLKENSHRLLSEYNIDMEEDA